MLISSSKDLPNDPHVSERDRILADALAYAESLEKKIKKEKTNEKRDSLKPDRAEDSGPAGKSSAG
jgi:hypothetical protein